MGARKEKLTLGRAEAALRLQALADQLREGTLHFGDQRFEVGDQIWLDIQADADELELEFKWRPLREGERPKPLAVPIRRACE